jgi:hypothetical protein
MYAGGGTSASGAMGSTYIMSGLLPIRELDERLGLSQLTFDNLTDHRRGKNTQLPLPDLLCPSICSRLAGYKDLNNAETQFAAMLRRIALLPLPAC